MGAFEGSKKMGSADLSNTFKESLAGEINDSHKFFVQNNRLKNMLGAFKTPIVLLAAMLIGMLAGWLCNKFWLSAFSSLFYNFALLAFTCLTIWVINIAQECRFDLLNTIAGMVDTMADTAWMQAKERGIEMVRLKME